MFMLISTLILNAYVYAPILIYLSTKRSPHSNAHTYIHAYIHIYIETKIHVYIDAYVPVNADAHA